MKTVTEVLEMLLEAGRGCSGSRTEMGLRPILIHYNHAVLTFDPPHLKIRYTGLTGIFNNYTIFALNSYLLLKSPSLN